MLPHLFRYGNVSKRFLEKKLNERKYFNFDTNAQDPILWGRTGMGLGFREQVNAETILDILLSCRWFAI
ncbi:MAG: hypothetical protein RBG13Loki_2429 [Promethearchaeota archaeon CR_4]|nr:MAG: hypothetical protein RBG13Loki_2429 [Candidatus Lokiarchaeota archaeon CR_4]